MGKLVIIILLLIVFWTLNERRKNARKQKEAQERWKELSKPSPEEEKKTLAWQTYRDNPCEETLQAFEEAVAADVKHWITDFIMGIRYDAGIDGFPFDRARAQSWYAKARAKATGYGVEDYVRELDRFFEYYNRPYGNFKNPDIRSEQTRRLQTALLMCVHCTDGEGGILYANRYNGVRDYIMDLPGAIRMIRQMSGHSPLIIKLLEDYKAQAESSPVLGVPVEERRAQFNDFLKYAPSQKSLSEPGMDYRFFIFGLLTLTDRTPYFGLLREFIENDAKVSTETACVRYFGWAVEGGSAEGIYMALKEQDAFGRVYNWDDSKADYELRDLLLEYTGNVGWSESAKRMAEEFFPGTEEKDWIFD